MRLRAFLVRHRGELTISLLTVLISVWALTPAPVHEGPGTPMQFTRGDLTDTGVIGLTVDSGGRDLNADMVRRLWVRHSPTWLDALLLRMELGEGQPEARSRGVAAARRLAGQLPAPRAVHPGRVSGTSSGLAWSLATLAAAHPQLTAAGRVAATGTLETSDVVDAVGALDVKMTTPALDDAAVILVPYVQLAEARQARDLRTGQRSPVVGVRHVDEALGLLCVLAGDRSGPCARYGDAAVDTRVSVELGAGNAGLCNRLRVDGLSCRPGDVTLVLSRSRR